MNDNNQERGEWAIYAIIPPASSGELLMVAPTIRVAFDLGVEAKEYLLPAQMMIIANHTEEWLERSPRSAQSTRAILAEKRAGVLCFDYDEECWVRIA